MYIYLNLIEKLNMILKNKKKRKKKKEKHIILQLTICTKFCCETFLCKPKKRKKSLFFSFSFPLYFYTSKYFLFPCYFLLFSLHLIKSRRIKLPSRMESFNFLKVKTLSNPFFLYAAF